MQSSAFHTLTLDNTQHIKQIINQRKNIKHAYIVYTVYLSYSRRVTVVIRFLRKRWYTVSEVITYSVRSSQSYTRRISPGSDGLIRHRIWLV